MSTCRVGAAAPMFSLEVAKRDSSTGRVGLADYRGRWLALMFYPRDFSFVCPTELTDFSSKAAAFADRNCDLLAVSPDTLESHLQWMATPTSEGGVQGLRYPLGSDCDGLTCRSYGVWREDDDLPNRGLFLIDPDGVLRYSVIHDLSVGRNAADVLRVIDALISGGLCPANWSGTDGVLDVESMLKPGRVLGHYRIVHELGRGAFGVVLSADDVRLGRRVALKIFQQQTSESTTKLIAEARAAAVIDHPNVCTIHAVDEMDGMSTIVMEYIQGGALSGVIRNGLQEANLRTITRRIASGLRAAHDKGVVHGDLKPANVLLREQFDPVIVDFGLARSRAERADGRTVHVDTSQHAQVNRLVQIDDSEETIDTTLANERDATSTESIDSTISHVIQIASPGESNRKISGTPAYMSPEQARGESLSEASDVFSLGVIVTELLIADAPHRQSNAIEIIRRLQNPNAISSIVDQVPTKYREPVGAMLASVPERRPTAQEVENWFC